MSDEEVRDQYDIKAKADKYSGHWLVVRKSNNTIAFSSPDLRMALRWIKSWGEDALERGGPQCFI